jgi:hypothetical protein
MKREASKAKVYRDLDTMRDILAPLDDDGREGMLATMIWWWAKRQHDRVAAITRLLDRVVKIEAEITREDLLQ